MHKPKIHPILFNTEMVRATMDGRKTQTRRLIPWKFTSNADTDRHDPTYFKVEEENGDYWDGVDLAPYAVDSLLWVRETFAEIPGGDGAVYKATWRKDGWEKGPDAKWHPSIHMPKWACRTWLKVTNVRAERLQDISEADAIAEGVEKVGIKSFYNSPIYKDYKSEILDEDEGWFLSAVLSFKSLWDSLAKKGTRWSDNPWVWVYEFESCGKPEGWDA